MNFEIITEAPRWFILFCLLTGAGFAALLYWREKRTSEAPRWARRSMLVLRFLSISALTFLLLSPLIKTMSREVQKPIVVLAQDNSESLVMNKDSAYYRTQYPKQLQELVTKLSDKYEVRTFTYGEKFREGIETTYKDKQTDISSVFDEVQTRFSDRNLGAVILAGDGLYNKGLNPVFASEKIKAPIFTIGLGDTTVKRDLVLTKVLNNRIAYLGNKFPLEAVIDARRCPGEHSTLTVSQGSTTLFSQAITVNGDAFTTTIPLLLDAKAPGLQRYHVALSSVSGETNLKNNALDVFIDVIDGREKVLILSAAPHPDVAALKETIEKNDNYEVVSELADKFTAPVKGYNLVILHGLPSVTQPIQRVLSEITAANIPVWYITGVQSGYTNFNNLKTGVTINRVAVRSGDADDREAVPNRSFNLFTLSDAAWNMMPRFPALSVPFGTLSASNGSIGLVGQKIGSGTGVAYDQRYPLWVFGQQGERKVCVIAAEGIWRWRMRDFAEHGNQDIFTELVSKTVQYLSVKVDKSFFRVSGSNNFLENEPVELQAEVYNQSYELITDPEVSITITNTDNKQYPFTFSKTANAYRLNAGTFAVGQYRYDARVKVGEKMYQQKGEFSVSPVMVESVNTTADHQALYNLAKRHNGDLVDVKNMQKLVDVLNAREDIKPIIYTPKRLIDFINLDWFFFLLLILFSAEWFMRKRHGAY